MQQASAINGVGGASNLLRNRLTHEELATVARLAARDREVRLHEAQHAAIAGDLALGGPQFTYQTGPDGKLYAIGGEVKLSMKSGRTPEETISRAQRMQAAATSPASPSGADLAVAAQAARMEAEARRNQFGDPNESSVITRADQLDRPRPQGPTS